MCYQSNSTFCICQLYGESRIVTHVQQISHMLCCSDDIWKLCFRFKKRKHSDVSWIDSVVQPRTRRYNGVRSVPRIHYCGPVYDIQFPNHPHTAWFAVSGLSCYGSWFHSAVRYCPHMSTGWYISTGIRCFACFQCYAIVCRCSRSVFVKYYVHYGFAKRYQ